jgi:hypothetical protein
MSKAQIHEFKNIFLASPMVAFSEVSAPSGITYAAPAADEILEVWQLDIDASATNGNTVGIQVRDGEGGDILHKKELSAGGQAVINWGGLPRVFSNNVWIETVGDPNIEGLRVALTYVPRKTR